VLSWASGRAMPLGANSWRVLNSAWLTWQQVWLAPPPCGCGNKIRYLYARYGLHTYSLIVGSGGGGKWGELIPDMRRAEESGAHKKFSMLVGTTDDWKVELIQTQNPPSHTWEIISYSARHIPISSTNMARSDGFIELFLICKNRSWD